MRILRFFQCLRDPFPGAISRILPQRGVLRCNQIHTSSMAAAGYSLKVSGTDSESASESGTQFQPGNGSNGMGEVGGNPSPKDYKCAIVVIPPPPLWKPIQTVRQIHDRVYRRWMPHINLYALCRTAGNCYVRTVVIIFDHFSCVQDVSFPSGQRQPVERRCRKIASKIERPGLVSSPDGRSQIVQA